MNQKGFAQILVVIFLLLAIPIGVYVVQHPTNFLPFASTTYSSSPKSVQVLSMRYFPVRGNNMLDPNITGIQNTSLISIRTTVNNLDHT